MCIQRRPHLQTVLVGDLRRSGGPSSARACLADEAVDLLLGRGEGGGAGEGAVHHAGVHVQGLKLQRVSAATAGKHRSSLPLKLVHHRRHLRTGELTWMRCARTAARSIDAMAWSSVLVTMPRSFVTCAAVSAPPAHRNRACFIAIADCTRERTASTRDAWDA